MCVATNEVACIHFTFVLSFLLTINCIHVYDMPKTVVTETKFGAEMKG